VNLKEAQSYIDKHAKYCVQMPGFAPIVAIEARGSILKDINGRQYIDFVSQTSGTAGVGSCHPRVVEAIKKQADSLLHNSAWLINIPKVELAEKLAGITPPKLKKFHFLGGGGETNEFALHLAMRHTKKKEAISLYMGYHGASIAMLNLGQAAHRHGLPAVAGFRQIPPAYCYRCFYGQSYPQCNHLCARFLEEKIRHETYHDVAALIMEPMPANGGHIMPPDKTYFKIIREICDKYGIVLIFDEIQTGVGRVGEMWAADYYDTSPDILVMGKGIPLGAAAISGEIRMPPDEDQEIISTFAGSALMCAAASAVVDVVLEEKLPQRAKKLGVQIEKRLKQMQEKHRLIGEVRGTGLFWGVELVKDRKTKEKAAKEAVEVCVQARDKGLSIILSGKAGIGNVLNIKPPMTIGEDLLEKGLDILDGVLGEVERDIRR
jgi:4-aminobutyrate aminotransferase-like enzyme